MGAWCFLPGPVPAQAYSGMGYDYVAIDMQHGLIDQRMALEMLQAIDLGAAAPVVRVPANEAHYIGRALDDGAAAVIVPMIESADDARNAVQAGWYAPKGNRSFGPIRAGLRDGPSYFADANDGSISIVPMIETRGAVDALDEILSVDGVDIAYVGPFDLSVSLGLPPKNNDGNAAFDRALGLFLESCAKHDVVPAIHADTKIAPSRLEQGFRMVTCGIDFTELYAAMTRALRTAKGS